MTEGFFDALAETWGDLSRYLPMTYALAIACRRLSFHPMRDTIVHTMWHPVAPILDELSAVSVVPDRGVMGSVVIRAETFTSEFVLISGFNEKWLGNQKHCGPGDPLAFSVVTKLRTLIFGVGKRLVEDVVKDQSEIARLGHVTPARLSQIAGRRTWLQVFRKRFCSCLV